VDRAGSNNLPNILESTGKAELNINIRIQLAMILVIGVSCNTGRIEHMKDMLYKPTIDANIKYLSNKLRKDLNP
jgi:hypothetical protein